MTNQDEDLQRKENWDFDSAEEKPARRRRRTVVSVALSRGDFDIVAAFAETHNRRLSELFREAVLSHIDAQMSTITPTPLDLTEGRWGIPHVKIAEDQQITSLAKA